MEVELVVYGVMLRGNVAVFFSFVQASFRDLQLRLQNGQGVQNEGSDLVRLVKSIFMLLFGGFVILIEER